MVSSFFSLITHLAPQVAISHLNAHTPGASRTPRGRCHDLDEPRHPKSAKVQYSVSTPNIRRSTHPSYAPPRPVSWEAHPRVEHGKITEVDAIRGYVEALHDALRGAGDDRLDPLQFLQRHAVVAMA